MEKNLEYYLGLPYIIEVVPLTDSEGGGYIARLPEIGRLAITGEGESPEEAFNDLNNIKRERFIKYLEKGVEIPEPEKESEDYSGRFLLRLPKILHRQIALDAKKNKTSLNQYINYLLATNFSFNRNKQQYQDLLKKLDVLEDSVGVLSTSRNVYETEEAYVKKGRKPIKKNREELFETKKLIKIEDYIKAA